MRLFKRTRELAVEFCDRCGLVTTPADRWEAILARARERAIIDQGRVA